MPMLSLICPACGEPFKRTGSRNPKYCSHACYAKSRVGTTRVATWRLPTGRKRGLREQVQCAHCSKPMEILASGARKPNYCSRPCYYASRGGRPRKPWAKVEQKACLVCGKTFEVGGVGRPPRRQRMCSDACQRRARYRRGAQASALSQADAVYLAAFIDGEGAIMISHSRGTCNMLLTAANTHKPILDWIATTTAVGAVCNARPESERHKPGYFWRCNADAAESVLRQIAPHLRIKRAQAELAISFQERLRDPALKADRAWQLEAMAKMRAMNRRGPRPHG